MKTFNGDYWLCLPLQMFEKSTVPSTFVLLFEKCQYEVLKWIGFRVKPQLGSK